ncbi:hypothetical protein LguiB_027797 [Lonicera macranthoides]
MGSWGCNFEDGDEESSGGAVRSSASHGNPQNLNEMHENLRWILGPGTLCYLTICLSTGTLTPGPTSMAGNQTMLLTWQDLKSPD